MSANQYRSILVASLLLAGSAGCDIDVHDCDKEPDAAICQEDEEEDAGDIEDEDAAVDAGRRDATVDAGGDSGNLDGSQDASGDAARSDGSSAEGGSSSISVNDFCREQLKTAVAWREALDELCGGITKDRELRDTFLSEVLAYRGDDPEGACIATRNAAIMTGNTTYDGTKAQACADSFAGNFMMPPSPFPTNGIDLAMYEAKIAHGAPTLVQIPVCRMAFAGKLARGMPCADNFECRDGLRCLDAPGGGKTCEPALAGGTCLQNSNCADNYTCVGSSQGGGRTCVKSNDLPLNGGNCALAFECAEGLDCVSGKCANPVANVVCM